jgi:drug/metabolite transporter (DMT)-like permease
MQKHRLFAPLLLLATALLWSFGGVLIKSVEWNALAIAGMRSAIAALVILACIRHPRVSFSAVQIGGAIAYAATVILFVLATRLTTAANAIFLQYTAPIYVAALGHWCLGERALRIDWLVMGIALGGIALFFIDQLTLAGMWGNVTALASGVTFAAMVVLLRKEKSGSPVASVLMGNILTAVITSPFMLGPMPPLQSWKALALLGTVQLGLSYVFYTIAIKRVTALEATLIPLLEPVLNPLWVMLAIGERPGPWATLGAAFVVGAVLVRGILMLRPRRTPKEW